MVKKTRSKKGLPLGMVAGAIAVLYFVTKAEAAPPIPGLANLSGRITDAETGYPVEGVLVTLNGMQVRTDSGGNYVFTGLEPRGYSGSASKYGYDTGYF